MRATSLVARGYIDVFTKTGKKTRCWNRRDEIICAHRVKKLRVARTEAIGIRDLIMGASKDSRLWIGKVTIADINKAL